MVSTVVFVPPWRLLQPAILSLQSHVTLLAAEGIVLIIAAADIMLCGAFPSF
jgi:hypothetical protein